MKLNKKLIIIICGIILLIGIVLAITIITLNNNKTDNDGGKTVDTTYTAYVSINPLVKLTFKVSCKNDVCSEPIITDYELENDDAKEIYKDIEVKNKTLDETIELLANTAKDNNYNFEVVNVYTDWESNEYFENENYDYNINMEIKTEEELENLPNDIIEEDPNNPIITKTIPTSLQYSGLREDLKVYYRQDAALGPNVYWSAEWNSGTIPIPLTNIIIKGKKSIVENVYSSKMLAGDNDDYVEAFVNLESLDVGNHKAPIYYKCSNSEIEIIQHDETPWIEVVISKS